ncbi:MAG TPA: c-type cytochrome domain-containing protein [Verrucomicrobiae bacterium]
MKSITYLGLTASLLAAGWSAQAADTDWSKLPAASKKANVTFTTDIQPLMQASCVRCHGAEHPKAGLRLDTLEGVLKGTRQGAVVKAGDSAHSLLVKSVSQLDPEIAMPPKGRKGHGGPGGPPGGPGPGMHDEHGGPGPDGQPPRKEGNMDHPPGAPQGTNAPGQPPRGFGPPAKPLTPEQVGLVRAWIDQGAK